MALSNGADRRPDARLADALQLRNAELAAAIAPVHEAFSTGAARIVLPKGCDFPAYFIVGVDPPDRSERVNVYLPRSLIGRVDRCAADLGMSRSSFFGLAITEVLSAGSAWAGLAEPRSKVHGTGRLRTKTPARQRRWRRAGPLLGAGCAGIRLSLRLRT